MRSDRARAVVGGFSLLLVACLAPATLAQELTAEEIIDRAVARAEEQQEAQPELGFRARVESIVENLNGDGEVKKTERETYQQYPLEGVLYEELVAKEGEPLSAGDARDERERREEFVEDVRERVAKGEEPLPEDENQIEFNAELFDRYELRIAGEEVVDGHPCWIIGIEPRAGDLPVRRRVDNALNNATGRVWVSKEDYGLARIEFEMVKSVRFWGGILGTLRNTVGRMEFTRTADRVWLPLTMDIKLDLRILFRNLRRRMIREWADYTPARASDS